MSYMLSQGRIKDRFPHAAGRMGFNGVDWCLIHNKIVHLKTTLPYWAGGWSDRAVKMMDQSWSNILLQY